MKRIIALLMAALMCFAMAACGAEEPAEAAVLKDGDVIGEGAASFSLCIVNAAGEEISVTVNTDEETVGAALLALGVVDGEVGDYGLFIKSVNGEAVDFDKDGKYWAFYINDAYAETGVDSTPIESDVLYTLKVE